MVAAASVVFLLSLSVGSACSFILVNATFSNFKSFPIPGILATNALYPSIKKFIDCSKALTIILISFAIGDLSRLPISWKVSVNVFRKVLYKFLMPPIIFSGLNVNMPIINSNVPFSAPAMASNAIPPIFPTTL